MRVNHKEAKDAFLAVSEEASTMNRQATNDGTNNVEKLRSELMRQSAEKHIKNAL